MEAVCRGVEEEGGLSVGILPGDDVGRANPFVTVPFEGREYDIGRGDQRLVLDFDTWQRR